VTQSYYLKAAYIIVNGNRKINVREKKYYKKIKQCKGA
jgi:hypothetical protein